MGQLLEDAEVVVPAEVDAGLGLLEDGAVEGVHRRRDVGVLEPGVDERLGRRQQLHLVVDPQAALVPAEHRVADDLEVALAADEVGRQAGLDRDHLPGAAAQGRVVGEADEVGGRLLGQWRLTQLPATAEQRGVDDEPRGVARPMPIRLSGDVIGHELGHLLGHVLGRVLRHGRLLRK